MVQRWIRRKKVAHFGQNPVRTGQSQFTPTFTGLHSRLKRKPQHSQITLQHTNATWDEDNNTNFFLNEKKKSQAILRISLSLKWWLKRLICYWCVTKPRNGFYFWWHFLKRPVVSLQNRNCWQTPISIQNSRKAAVKAHPLYLRTRNTYGPHTC